jgi:tetrapyrrole methylase family protein/MazG family protein
MSSGGTVTGASAVAEAMPGWERLVGVVERLLGPGGCPWDREQTHSSLRGYLLEEAYELLEAIDADDPVGITEELGDLLIHILFHSEIARVSGSFSTPDVLKVAADKLVGRHPHVFEDSGEKLESAEQVLERWEDLKRKEKGSERLIANAVPKAMPALAYAAELQNRVERAGLDWRDGPPTEAGLGDVKDGDDGQAKEDAAGEALFRYVAELRGLGIDPETALRQRALAFRDRLERAEKSLEGVAFAEAGDEERQSAWEKNG